MHPHIRDGKGLEGGGFRGYVALKQKWNETQVIQTAISFNQAQIFIQTAELCLTKADTLYIWHNFNWKTNWFTYKLVQQYSN